MAVDLPKILHGDGMTPKYAVKFEPSSLALSVAAELEFISSRLRNRICSLDKTIALHEFISAKCMVDHFGRWNTTQNPFRD